MFSKQIAPIVMYTFLLLIGRACGDLSAGGAGKAAAEAVYAVSAISLEAIGAASDTFASTLIIFVCVLLAMPLIVAALSMTSPAPLNPASAPIVDANKLGTPVLAARAGHKHAQCGPGQRTVASPKAPSVRHAATSPLLHLQHKLEYETSEETSKSDTSSQCSYWPLCSYLVVAQPGGQTFEMIGQCEPYQQQDVIRISRINFGHDRELVARAILSEVHEGGGIILESSSRVPLAKLDTSHAVGKRDASPPAGRYVSIFRPSKPSDERSDERSLVIPVGTVQADGAQEGFIMWRGAVTKKDIILAMRIHGGGRIANIVDVDGKLLAAVEVCDTELRSNRKHLIHVAEDVDAALIMVAVIASQKLR